jgi:hypothetical protein
MKKKKNPTSAANAYRRLATKAASRWKPAKPRALVLANVRKPRVTSALSSREKSQLDFVLGSALEEWLASSEADVEVADFVEHGRVAFHLYAWNYGVGYLFGDRGREDLVAMATQHMVERWSVEQRELFWSIDRALARAKTKLAQPLSFDWQTDSHWESLTRGRRQWMITFLRKRRAVRA